MQICELKSVNTKNKKLQDRVPNSVKIRLKESKFKDETQFWHTFVKATMITISLHFAHIFIAQGRPINMSFGSHIELALENVGLWICYLQMYPMSLLDVSYVNKSCTISFWVRLHVFLSHDRAISVSAGLFVGIIENMSCYVWYLFLHRSIRGGYNRWH